MTTPTTPTTPTSTPAVPSALPPPLPPAAADAVGRPPEVAVAYQLTLADYAEASFGSPATGWRLAVRPALSLLFVLGSWAYLMRMIVLAPDAAALGRSAVDPAGGPAAVAPTAAWALAPVLAVPLCFLPAWRIALGRVALPWGRRADPARRSGGRRVAAMALAGGFTMVLYFAWLVTGAADWYDQVLVMSAAFYVVGLGMAFTLLYRAVAFRRLWARQRSLHLPKTMEAGEDGVVFADAETRMAYRWPAFAGYRETAGLLVLHPSSASVWMIPKRAFADPAGLRRFKALVSTHVREGFFLPDPARGFAVEVPLPVLPSPVPPPTPAGPADSGA